MGPHPVVGPKILRENGEVTALPECFKFNACGLNKMLQGPFVILRPPSNYGALLVARREWGGLKFNPLASGLFTDPERLIFGPAILTFDHSIP